MSNVRLDMAGRPLPDRTYPAETGSTGYKLHERTLGQWLEHWAETTPDKEYIVYLYQHIREDENSLFGFKTKEDRNLFLKLIDVKGLGPKMALPILATGSISGIIDAIERENILYLKKFPKIGDKVARQMVLDLKGKLGVTNTTNNLSNYEELIEVLKGLGYKQADISKVLPQIKTDLNIEEQVKEALKLLLK